MNDERKPPEEGQFEEGFQEDFDFGEGETEQESPMPTSQETSPGLNKKVIAISFIVVFTIIVMVGYRFYRSSSAKRPQASSTIPQGSAVPSIANAQPSKATPQTAMPTPPPTAATTIPTPPPPINPPPESFSEIDKAFSASEEVPAPAAAGQQTTATAMGGMPANAAAPGTPPPPPPSASGTPGKAVTAEGGTIHQLQKELFTPEGTKIEATTATAAESQQLAQGLTKLNQQIDYILNKIKYLDTYTQEVSQNLTKLNDSLATMDKRILALTNTTTVLSKDVGTVRSEVGHVRQVLKEDGLDLSVGTYGGKRSQGMEGKVSVEEPEYAVHAVIPGRAWLKSLKGQIITVAEGDTVGNYGKILVIDAANGVVLTSSGVTFH